MPQEEALGMASTYVKDCFTDVMLIWLLCTVSALCYLMSLQSTCAVLCSEVFILRTISNYPPHLDVQKSGVPHSILVILLFSAGIISQ